MPVFLSLADGNWIPSISTNGLMTISGVTIQYANYHLLGGRLCFVEISITATIGGTPNTQILATLPFTAKTLSTARPYYAGVGNYADGGGSDIARMTFASAPSSAANKIVFSKPALVAWVAGSILVYGSGFYEIQ